MYKIVGDIKNSFITYLEELNPINTSLKKPLSKAIIFSSKEILQENNRVKILENYNISNFIGIANPTDQACQYLWKLLQPSNPPLYTELKSLELYGVQKIGGNIEQFSFLQPSYPDNFTLEDKNISNKSRAENFIKMISEIIDKTIIKPNLLENDGGDPVNLFNQAQLYTDRVQYCLPVKNSNNQPVNCYYQIISKGQAVWVKDASNNEYDYYFIIQYSVFSPNPGYVANDSNNQGWYVNWYNLNVYPTNFLGNNAILMAQNSPGTTQGSTTASTSISETTGISIGFFGETGTANFDHSVTIGKSESFSIPDVSISNNSNSKGNNAQWDFNMPYVSDALSQPVLMARNTFQPITMMLWQADPTTVRTNSDHSKDVFSISFDFNLQYVYTYINDDGRKDSTYRPTTQTRSFKLPCPPKAAPPPSI